MLPNVTILQNHLPYRRGIESTWIRVRLEFRFDLNLGSTWNLSSLHTGRGNRGLGWTFKCLPDIPDRYISGSDVVETSWRSIIHAGRHLRPSFRISTFRENAFIESDFSYFLRISLLNSNFLTGDSNFLTGISNFLTLNSNFLTKRKTDGRKSSHLEFPEWFRRPSSGGCHQLDRESIWGWCWGVVDSSDREVSPGPQSSCLEWPAPEQPPRSPWKQGAGGWRLNFPAKIFAVGARDLLGFWDPLLYFSSNVLRDKNK